jgi:hypothetical protein
MINVILVLVGQYDLHQAIQAAQNASILMYLTNGPNLLVASNETVFVREILMQISDCSLHEQSEIDNTWKLEVKDDTDKTDPSNV